MESARGGDLGRCESPGAPLPLRPGSARERASPAWIGLSIAPIVGVPLTVVTVLTAYGDIIAPCHESSGDADRDTARQPRSDGRRARCWSDEAAACIQIEHWHWQV
jgi:hypothetical protein